MHRELPLYIFIRNTIILCFLFFIISAVIIERGRHERGENSLFNSIMIKQDDIRDYNNFDITKSQEVNPINEYSNITARKDSAFNLTYNFLITNLVENGNSSFIPTLPTGL